MNPQKIVRSGFLIMIILLAGHGPASCFGQPADELRSVPQAMSSRFDGIVQPPTLLPELEASDWADIQAGIRQAEYQFTWQAAGPAYLASNRSNGWQMAFGADGLRLAPVLESGAEGWSLGLRLASWGRGTALEPAALAYPAPRASSNRVEYAWKGGLSEWYQNDERGLEQGFTLQSRPAGESPLRLVLACMTPLQARLSADGQALAFEDKLGQALLHYAGLHVVDASGRTIPAHFELQGAHELAVVVDDRAARYPLLIDPLITPQAARLTAADRASGDMMGRAMAVSGDMVVVGAPNADVGGNVDQGAVYIFNRNQGGAETWGQFKKLTSADGAASDRFGMAILLAGDTLMVSAIYTRVGTTYNQGSVYIFERNQGGADNWGQVKKISAADGSNGDKYGWSLAVSGTTLAVGAIQADVGGNADQGAVYLYGRNQGGTNQWGLIRKLVAADGIADDQFGSALGAEGDLMVVGAAGADLGGVVNQGAVYLLARNEGGADVWGQVKKFTVPAAIPYANFGHSVGISGGTVVACGPGWALVFSRNQGGLDAWGQVAVLTPADNPSASGFGSSVAISADLIAVGAMWASIGSNSHQGAVYLYQQNLGGADQWGQALKLVHAGAAAEDRFGSDLALAGDRLVVGAQGVDAGSMADTGAAYVFTRAGGRWIQAAQRNAGASTDGVFGWQVALSGDVLVVGNDLATVGSHEHQGAAYVFARNQTGAEKWGLVKKLISFDGVAEDRFGDAVAVDGDLVVVGAPLAEFAAQTDRGAAYVFRRNQGGMDNWGLVTKLLAADGAVEDHFGSAVSVSNDIILVGAPWANISGRNNQGAAYLYYRNQGGAQAWGLVKKIYAADGAAVDWFGYSVAVDGEQALIGSIFVDIAGRADQGAAYVFWRNQGGADNWGQVARLTAGDGAADDQFGTAVALDRDRALVGVPRASVSGRPGQGAAYLFERNQGGGNQWGQLAKLTAKDGLTGDGLGIAVGLSGDRIVVGASQVNIAGQSDQGAVYIFQRNQGGPDAWGQAAWLLAADGTASDRFGASLAVCGTTLAVGAPWAEPGVSLEDGIVYIFNEQPPTIYLPFVRR